MTETQKKASYEQSWDDAVQHRRVHKPQVAPLVDGWEIAGSMQSPNKKRSAALRLACADRRRAGDGGRPCRGTRLRGGVLGRIAPLHMAGTRTP